MSDFKKTVSDTKNSINSADEFRQAVIENYRGIISVRPRVIFELVESKFDSIPLMHIPIPSSQIGSVTMLEAGLMCALLQLSKPKIIFEFGTFLGYSTSILLMNSPSSQVFSIDLPSESDTPEIKIESYDKNLIRIDDSYNDAFLTTLARKNGELY